MDRGAWTADMIAVLLDAKHPSDQAAPDGNAMVGSHRAAKLRARYCECLDQAFALLPDGPPRDCAIKADGRSTSVNPRTWLPACAATKKTSRQHVNAYH